MPSNSREARHLGKADQQISIPLLLLHAQQQQCDAFPYLLFTKKAKVLVLTRRRESLQAHSSTDWNDVRRGCTEGLEHFRQKNASFACFPCSKILQDGQGRCYAIFTLFCLCSKLQPNCSCLIERFLYAHHFRQALHNQPVQDNRK